MGSGAKPQPISILVYSEREKTHLKQLYMDFCILKFVKLSIKSPKLSLAHLSPTLDMDRRPWARNAL